MKEFKKTLGRMRKEKKGLVFAMIFLLLLSVLLMIFGLLSLKPGTSVVKIGYGDIGRYQGGEWSSMANSGGYQDGHWTNMLAFPILAIVFGVLHNLIAIRLYAKKGAGVAQIFVAVSIGLVVVAWGTLRRLLGEG